MLSAKKITIPNILTVFRMILILAIIPCFYFRSRGSQLLVVIIFFIACVTDYLDGYLARILKQTTKFGQLFDPIADKMLIATTLLLMAGFGYFSTYEIIPATVILCREILVSGLREYMIGYKISLPVTRLAKYKTAFQMLSIASLLMADLLPHQDYFLLFGRFSLWLAAFLTLITGYQYLKTTIEQI